MCVCLLIIISLDDNINCYRYYYLNKNVGDLYIALATAYRCTTLYCMGVTTTQFQIAEYLGLALISQYNTQCAVLLDNIIL